MSTPSSWYRRKRKALGVPHMETTQSFPCGTIHARLAHTNDGPTLGNCLFFRVEHEIDVDLNVANPAIRSAALTGDDRTLNCYIAAICLLGVRQFREQSGAWPWPHDDWPDVILTWESFERTVRDLCTVQ